MTIDWDVEAFRYCGRFYRPVHSDRIAVLDKNSYTVSRVADNRRGAGSDGISYPSVRPPLMSSYISVASIVQMLSAAGVVG
jgi:hypothetical protein